MAIRMLFTFKLTQRLAPIVLFHSTFLIPLGSLRFRMTSCVLLFCFLFITPRYSGDLSPTGLPQQNPLRSSFQLYESSQDKAAA